MADRVVREPAKYLRVREGRAASAVPGGRLLSAAQPPRPASDASALPRATLSIGPVLVGSKRFAPCPWAPAIHESGHSHFAATDQADQAGALHKGKLRSKFSVGQGVKKKSLVEEVAL